MYSLIKKSILTFLLLNAFIVQSAMADMLFYYNAAILPSIISSTGGGGSDGSNVNTTFKGSLAYEESDSYSFTAKSTGKVWFVWNDDNTDLSVYLYEGTNPDTYVYVNSDYDGGFTAFIEEGGTYTVKIVNKSSYSIDEYNVNTITTNDDRGEAVALVPNKSYTDTLNDQDNSLRVYNFVADSTGSARVRTNWRGSSKYAYTSLYENGIYQVAGQGSSNTETTFSTVKGRTYSIVQQFTDTDYANLEYNIEVITPNDTRGDAVSMVPNKPYIRTLNENKDSLDVYNFTASSDGSAVVRASWSRSSHYAYIYIYEDGIYQGGAQGSSSADISLNVMKDRNYTVVVKFTDTDEANTDYGIEVITTNDLRGDAVTISQNAHHNATMNENENFLDVYNFTATSTGTALVRAVWTRTSHYAYVYIYEDGIYQKSGQGSSSAELSFSLIENRKYTIVFKSTDTDSADASYTLNLATTDQTNATIVTLGTEYSSILNENTNTYATYSFTPTTDVSASAIAEGFGGYGYMYLYEDGIYQGGAQGSSSATYAYNFIAGRTYTMIVLVTDTNGIDADITFSINE